MPEPWVSAPTLALRYAAFSEAHCRRFAPCPDTQEGICATAHDEEAKHKPDQQIRRSLPKSKGRRVAKREAIEEWLDMIFP